MAVLLFVYLAVWRLETVYLLLSRLRGFYGSLGLAGQEEDLVLREAR